MESKFFEKQTEEQINSVAKMLERKVSSEKDNNNYNFTLFSEITDSSALLLAEIGLLNMKPTDVLKLSEVKNFFNVDKSQMFQLEEALRTGDYEQYRYNLIWSDELRAKYLLQTEASDNFKDLYNETKELLLDNNIITNEELDVIDEACKKAKKRLFDTNISFLQPMSKKVEGEKNILSKEELDELNIDGVNEEEDIFLDERFDNYDLLALKELNLIVKGKKVENTSIAAGFFHKIMPELIELGYDSIILKVSKDQLSKISLVSLIGRNNERYQLNYSPLKASVFLSQSELVDVNEKLTKKGGKITSFNNIDVNRFSSNDKYFVVVDGMVSAPDNKLLGYKESSFNIRKIKAGETFLFEKINGKVHNTRLYFTPYNYDHMHLYHHHGSVIFGTNDQSFHSCSEREKVRDIEINDLKTNWSKFNKFWKIPEHNSPAVISALYHEIKKDDTFQLFDPKNKTILNNIMLSVYEQSTITALLEVNDLKGKSSAYTKADFIQMVFDLTEKCLPLNKRMNVQYYEKHNTYHPEVQKTRYYAAGLNSYINNSIELFKELE